MIHLDTLILIHFVTERLFHIDAYIFEFYVHFYTSWYIMPGSNDATGQPISNAIITGSGSISITDQSGYFQIEIAQDDTSFEVRSGSSTCRTNFVQVKTEQSVVPLGNLTCM
jgi:hypothetical protein